MADYHAPTVVEPVIPLKAMTPLEHLVLGLVFDSEDDDGGVYFHSWCGPSDMVTVPFDNLREASQLSRDVAGSVIGTHVEALIATLDAQIEAEPHDEVDLDLSDPEIGWNRILQDIARRSSTLDEIVVWTAFTCTKMRSDGFGGAVTRITTDAIQYESTERMLGTMRAYTSRPAETASPTLR